MTVRPRVGEVWFCNGIRPDTVTRISRTRWKGRQHVWVHLRVSMTMTVREFLKQFRPNTSVKVGAGSDVP
jgi:hypothetical protein